MGAANSLGIGLASNEVEALIAVDASTLDSTRILIVKNVLQLLALDLWTRIKDDPSYQPTLAERMLILQLDRIATLNVIEFVISDL